LPTIEEGGHEVLLGHIDREHHPGTARALLHPLPINTLEFHSAISTLAHGDTSNISAFYNCKSSTCSPSYEGPLSIFITDYAGRSFPTQVFWGDTHLHTGMSMDAGAFGARLGPEGTPIASPGARS
jgi:hypothetical protein